MCEWSMETAIELLVGKLNARAECLGSKENLFTATYLSDKWCRITRSDSAYAFIALDNFETKGLGNVTRGSIHKPASFKAPAKYARGSVFEQDNGINCCGEYGVSYLGTRYG